LILGFGIGHIEVREGYEGVVVVGERREEWE
jgi:hypothetical protein